MAPQLTPWHANRYQRRNNKIFVSLI